MTSKTIFDQIRQELEDREQDCSAHVWGLEMRSLEKLAEKSATSYLFEFSVFLNISYAIVDSIGGAWSIEEPKRGTAKGESIVWPLAPAHPDNFSYFMGKLDDQLVHIRPGVEAEAPKYETTIAPDVSLRLANGKNSLNETVLRMWDAKYRENADSRIARSEVMTFAMEKSLLVDSRCAASFDPHCTGPKHRAWMLSHCGLITNGRHSTESERLLEYAGIVEIERFSTSKEKCRGPAAYVPVSTPSTLTIS